MPSNAAKQQLFRLLDSELRGLLHRWGDWHEKFRVVSGLPPQTAFLNMPSTVYAGHRILMPDMPKKIFFLEQAILKLDDPHRGVLAVWYGYQRAPDGRWLEAQEKAQALQIPVGTLSARVHRARKKLLRLHKIWVT